jgi:predicted DNA-binding transcriptional regulator AlpA
VARDTSTNDDRPITTREAAELIGVSHLTLAEIRRRGGGPAYYRVGVHGRTIRYRVGDVRRWIAERTVASAR